MITGPIFVRLRSSGNTKLFSAARSSKSTALLSLWAKITGENGRPIEATWANRGTLPAVHVITPESKHVNGCHAGLDPASTPVMDSRFRGKDRIDSMVAGRIKA
jgi:hypothetical protein